MTIPTSSTTYRCAICGGVFAKVDTDEAALERLRARFPGVAVEDCLLACDDCYREHFGGPQQ